MITPLRVALFTDAFSEANGVGTLSRELTAFAQRRRYPFFCVHSGPRTKLTREKALTTVELKRGFASFRLDHDLYCDPLLSRYRNKVLAYAQAFRPDLVHITGPGDMGILGFWIAHLLRVPLVASWHTNLHEYAGRRLTQSFDFLPAAWRDRISKFGEEQSLRACMWFYHYPRFTLAPNDVMVNLLRERTGKPSFLMDHGVDTEIYSPSRRIRRSGPFCIGYVGRLTPEKNVRILAAIEKSLLDVPGLNFRLLVIGEGSERAWLRKNLRRGELAGIVRDDALANAFANMDVFVFPSQTDTFGLVILEAMASGLPVLVSPLAGARVGIEHGETGFHADTSGSFTSCILKLIGDEALRRDMGCAARRFACSRRWDEVFDRMYRTYEAGRKTGVGGGD